MTTTPAKKPRVMYTKRELLGDEFYLMMLRDYEEIRKRKKARKGKPDEYERIIHELDKVFEDFYKRVLD